MADNPASSHRIGSRFASRSRSRTLRTWISHLLLWIFALIGVASIAVWLVVIALMPIGEDPPEMDSGSALAGRLGEERTVPLQSIGGGGWRLACLVPPHEWLDVVPLAGLPQAPRWSESEGVATLLLVGEAGRSLLVPFLRFEMDVAPAQGRCTQASPATRLIREGYVPMLVQFAD